METPISPGLPGKSFGILATAVDPRYQGFSIGKALMHKAEATAVQQGFQRMHLTVNPSNPQAVGFYESLTWKKPSLDENWNGRMVKELVNGNYE